MTRVAVNGITGRMGGAVAETAADRDCEVVVGFATSDVAEVAGVPVVHPDEAADALAEYDVDAVVDFAVPEGALTVADACAATGTAMVVGTTGFDEAGLDRLDAVAAEVPLLKAANFSPGIQVLQRTVREAVRALDDYDLELLESHHNGKVDAPSGTANSILDTVREERDVEPVYGREGHAPREDDEIGVFARRAGDIRGEHELLLAGNDEVLSLSHRAEDRAVFAAGALDAAVWLADREPGRYEFSAVVDA
ncbi:4-hydroxy-tetrahydrodipicolinate reductase [Haloarcula litorea]|uniref:4-hydroxy-tetrahydrodipicolinate reductase n=1 Tax=Haloarcula litorea TaxID=3032579 RepID=UPI0023E812E1|nr:4-hydroxy-tetrahydrodipicolinate reductase [Halomicroarcula sp. GDY20]